MLKIHDMAPDFELTDDNRQMVRLRDFQSKWIVLYFYPKDNTTGCTLEAREFSASIDSFDSLQTIVFGVSPDSVESHCKFRDKYDLKLRLLSDPDHHTLEAYNVYGLKKMMGREYYGVIRSTFIIDPKGVIRALWRQVKVNHHVNDVLQTLESLQNGEKQ
jgi:peroxiredoxin Q/BCP